MLSGQSLKGGAAIAQRADWREAMAEATSQLAAPPQGGPVDLAFLFASSDYVEDFPDLVASARRATGMPLLIGCSGQGVIGPSREIEGRPALSLLALSLPGAALRPLWLTQADLALCRGPEEWRRLTDVAPDDVNAWLLFVDPFTLDAERLVAGLSEAYPGTPLLGGLASGDHHRRQTHLFLGDQVHGEGAVALALGGPYRVRPIVSQGCTPIGDTWTITSAQGQVIETIARRPAYEVLVETVRALPPELQERARGNIFVGLAMDEYRDVFRRGDFLIRNLLGIYPETKALVVGAQPWVGQTLQFQLRDPAAADDELRAMLATAKAELAGEQPVAALLCACNGRGRGLFGAPDHDAQAVAEGLGPIPLAGFFCNGEIGPVGGRNFLHGYTASIALVLRQ